MPEFNDSININGNNYSRINTTIEISGLGIDTTDLSGGFLLGIDYSESQEKEFGFTLGSNRPSHFGAGNITAEGTLTLTDAGLAKLNEIAVASGLPNYLYLGQAGSVNITISYVTYNDLVKTDILEEVHFTTYTNGVNTDDILYTREVPMIIGKVSQGALV